MGEATLSAGEAQREIEAAIAALRAGRAGEAQKRLAALTARPSPVPAPWFLLAQACRQSGDEAAEAEALDRTLAQQPRNIGALIMRGDLHERAGDRRAAGSFYRSAVVIADAAGDLPPILRNEVERVLRFGAGLEAEFADHLEAHLSSRGLGPGQRSRHFQDALDIMLGKKRIYLQEPTSFYFPGLPQIEYYEEADFPWLEPIKAAVPAIRSELEQVVAEDGAFRPYVEADPNRPTPTNKLLGDPSWSAFHLYRHGEPLQPNAGRCPATMAALAHAPLPFIRGRSPMALFSLLRPGAHIAAHNGLFNTRLICHVPIIVPSGCRLRVGNETREWEAGKALIFDDSIEHEAWNPTAETRVILLFEIWRPELDEADRAALTAMAEAITEYAGAPPGEG